MKSRDQMMVPKVPDNMQYEMLPFILAQATSLNHLPQKTQTEIYMQAKQRASNNN